MVIDSLSIIDWQGKIDPASLHIRIVQNNKMPRFQTISRATLYERFPTEEERDLWWEHQRMLMSEMVSDTDEERRGYAERARLLWEDIVYIQFARHCKEEEDAKPLPVGVEEMTATNGRKYYVNHNTHTTSWTKPKPKRKLIIASN